MRAKERSIESLAGNNPDFNYDYGIRELFRKWSKIKMNGLLVIETTFITS